MPTDLPSTRKASEVDRGSLIIECTPNLLESAQMNFMGQLGLAARFMPDLNVHTILARTQVDLVAGLHWNRIAGGRDLVLVVGHADPKEILVTDDGKVDTWPEFGRRLAPLSPTTIVLLGCEAGDWLVADGLFRQIGSLQFLVGSPLTLSVPQAALGVALHLFGVTKSNDDDWRLGQFLSTILAGTLFWRWTRAEFEDARSEERAVRGLTWSAVAAILREKLEP